MVVKLHPHLMAAPLYPQQKRMDGGGRKEDLLAWDRQYGEKGRIWRGAPAKIPDLPAGSRVLELGCGNGKTLAAMLRRPWRVTALDISTLALRLGRDSSKDRYHPAGPDFVAADAVHLPFQEGGFDAVIAFHVLGHLREIDRRRAAAEAARVLRGGGQLFFLDFGVDDMRAGKGEEVEAMTFRRGGGVFTHYFTEGEVIELFDILRLTSMITDRRLTRIRGVDHLRSEVAAEFIKQEG